MGGARSLTAGHGRRATEGSQIVHKTSGREAGVTAKGRTSGPPLIGAPWALVRRIQHWLAVWAIMMFARSLWTRFFFHQLPLPLESSSSSDQELLLRPTWMRSTIGRSLRRSLTQLLLNWRRCDYRGNDACCYTSVPIVTAILRVVRLSPVYAILQGRLLKSVQHIPPVEPEVLEPVTEDSVHTEAAPTQSSGGTGPTSTATSSLVKEVRRNSCFIYIYIWLEFSVKVCIGRFCLLKPPV